MVEEFYTAAVQRWQHIVIDVGLRARRNLIDDPSFAKLLARLLARVPVAEDAANLVGLQQPGEFGDDLFR